MRYLYRTVTLMTLVQQLLKTADAYAAARGLSLSRVSTLAFGDGKILHRLAQGKDLTTRRLEAAMVFFSQDWPEWQDWPAAVPRPEWPQPLADAEANPVGSEPRARLDGAEG